MFRIYRFLMIMALSMSASMTAQSQFNWISQAGPWRADTVRNMAGAYDQNDNLYLYATNRDTLVKSTDGGSTWAPTAVSITFPRLVACKITNPDIVVAVTRIASGQVNRSTNSGTNWQNPPPIDEAELIPLRLAFSSSGSDTVFLGTNLQANKSSLRKSFDGGVNWSEDPYFKNTVQTNLTSVAFNPANARVIWVGGSQGTTTNEQFQYIPFAPEGALEDEAIVGGVWRTANGGGAWASNTLGGHNVTALAASIENSSDTDRVFAGTMGDASLLFRGRTGTSPNWQAVTSFPVTAYGITEVRDIKIHPAATDYIFVATDRGVFYSDDVGYTWYKSTDGMYDTDVRTLMFDPNNETILYAGTPTAIFKNESQGNGTWYALNTGIDIAHTSAINIFSGVILAGSRDVSAVAGYGDGAWNNYQVWTGGPFQTEALASNGSYAFVCGAFDSTGAIFGTSDVTGGWDSLYCFSLPETKIYTVVVHPDSEANVYAGGYGGSTGNFLKSTNGGTNWDSYTISSTDRTVYTLAINTASGTLYAGLDSGGVWKSTNGGVSWTQLGLFCQKIKSIALNSTIPSVLYAGGDSGLYRSLDTGNTWSQVRSDTVKRILMHPATTDVASNCFVVARAAGDTIDHVYEGKHFGYEWRNVTGGLAATISDLTSDPDNNTVLYGATSAGVYSLPLLAPDAITLASPANGDTLQESALTFSWNTMFGASTYAIQVADSINFTALEVDEPGLYDTTFQAASLFQGKRYYWRVRGHNDIDDGAWSSVDSFIVAPMVATISGPSTLIYLNVGTYHVSVTNSSGDISYQWSRKNDSTSTWANQGTDSTQADTMYVEGFTVKCVVTDNGTGKDTTATMDVGYALSAAPTLVSPTNNATGQPSMLTLKWNRLVGSSTYRLQVSKDTLFTTQKVVDDSTLTDTTKQVTLSGSTNYFWHVRASNSYGNSAWSSIWKFTTQADSTPPAPQLTGDEWKRWESGVLKVSPILIWTSSGSNMTYKLYRRWCDPEDCSDRTSTVMVYSGSALLDTDKTVNLLREGDGWVSYNYYVKAVSNINQLTSAPSNEIQYIAANDIAKHGVAENYKKKLPKEFSLVSNYPNPFNPITHFEYALPSDVYVTFKIYDMLGRELAKLVDGYQDAGYKSVEFDASKLPSGLYFYRLQAGKFIDVKKMLLMK